MNKLIAGFMFVFFFCSLFSAFMDGAAGAAAATDLTAACDEDDVLIDVTDTTGFLDAGGVLFIGSEKVEYTATAGGNQFIGLTRGFEKTEADTHPVGRQVYNEDAGVINYALGFTAFKMGGEMELGDLAMIPWNFTTITLPKLLMWDFTFLEGNLVVVRYALQAMSVGFVIYLTFQVAGTIISILRTLV